MDDAFVECPVCGCFMPADEVPEHVETHFNGDKEASDHPAQHEAAAGMIRCSQCSVLVSIGELDSHEEAHRCAPQHHHFVTTLALSCMRP